MKATGEASFDIRPGNGKPGLKIRRNHGQKMITFTFTVYVLNLYKNFSIS